MISCAKSQYEAFGHDGGSRTSAFGAVDGGCIDPRQ
jgi:hypothetical protein